MLDADYVDNVIVKEFTFLYMSLGTHYMRY